MRKTKAETAETRKRILEVAAREFRRNGILGTGLAEIMSAAGLTHGGFYRHFASKDQLVAEAFAADMEIALGLVEAAAEEGEDAFLKHIESYLSTERRDDCLGPCPLSAIGSELRRADVETRRAVSRGVRAMIDIVARQTRSADPSSARADAIFAISSMIGAITLSRVVDDRELSDSILSETRNRLTSLQTKSRRKHGKSHDE